MYTYKRFRTSKSAVIIILIALALAAWGILGSTGTPLAKKAGTPFDVTLLLNGAPYSGEAVWPVGAPYSRVSTTLFRWVVMNQI